MRAVCSILAFTVHPVLGIHVRQGEANMASGTEAALASKHTTATVLIVDDEDSTRNLCRDVVTEAGFRSKVASTTEQALEILDEFPIDIVITDLRVPAMGGI